MGETWELSPHLLPLRHGIRKSSHSTAERVGAQSEPVTLVTSYIETLNESRDLATKRNSSLIASHAPQWLLQSGKEKITLYIPS